MKRFEIKKCPICGSLPALDTRDLGRNGGHGYPGETNFSYGCPTCGLVKKGSADTIFPSATKDEAHNKAIERWNENVDKTIELMQGGILKEKTGRYEYDVNKLERAFETYRPYVVKKLRADLDLEILGIETIMEFCDDPEVVSKVNRRIKRIKDLFAKELNEENE